jgi:hypothetical protein
LAEDRHSKAEDAQLLTDPDEIARREAENGLRQFNLAIKIIATYVRDRDRPFKLRAGPILQLHKAALDGLHRLAGTFRNTPVKIDQSPPNRQNLACNARPVHTEVPGRDIAAMTSKPAQLAAALHSSYAQQPSCWRLTRPKRTP